MGTGCRLLTPTGVEGVGPACDPPKTRSSLTLMAKIGRNAAHSGLPGQIGRIDCRQYGDTTVGSKVPAFAKSWSTKPAALRARMKAASACADSA